MGERLASIREGWRLGAAAVLMTAGFWYEAHAIDKGIQGNTGAATEFGIEGAILLGAGTLTHRNHNRHIERVRRESITPDANHQIEVGPMIAPQEPQTSFLEAPEANQ